MHTQESSAKEGNARMHVDEVRDESGDERQAVVLESDGDTYLIAPGLDPSEGYVLYVLLPTPPTDGKGSCIDEQLVDDKNTPTTAPTPPRVESSIGLHPTPTPMPAIEIDAPNGDERISVPDPQVEPQISSHPPQPSSGPPPPAKTVPQSSHTKMLRNNLRDEDFSFRQDSVVICTRGEETEVRVKVVRWRWHI